ncbi:MAG: sugar transporter [Hyphomicrobiales bacterium]|nr:sugar transporter [Hyphomicrobiales bacterium]
MRQSFAILFLSALLLSGCASREYRAIYTESQQDEPYTLASGDRLRIIVYGQDTLSNTYAVDGSGQISMPLIGPFRALGMTLPQLEKAVESRLRNGFLREPRVAAEVVAYRPFFVIGEITTAGQYPFVNGMTVQNAIAIAGGFTPRAVKTSVDLTRIIDGVPVILTAPMTASVRPGDTLNVKERYF